MLFSTWKTWLASLLGDVIGEMDFRTKTPTEPIQRGLPIYGTGRLGLWVNPQFKKWFGRSQVVDSSGSPMMVFRGTRKEPSPDNEFNLTAGRAAPSFTDDAALASVYTRRTQGIGAKGYASGSTVTPVYLSIQKPLDISGFGEQISMYDLMDAMGMDLDDLKTEDVAQLYEDLYETADQVGAEFEDFMGRPSDFVLNFEHRDPITKLKTLRAIELDAFVVADSAKVVSKLIELGFDGVFHSEVTDGAMAYYEGPKDRLLQAVTFRPFFQQQIKSAIGNNGDFDPSDPRIDK